MSTSAFWLSLACLAVLPWKVQAQEAPERQEAPGRFMLESGLVGVSDCPGRYVSINGRVAGRVSLYGMLETHWCTDATSVTDLDNGTRFEMHHHRVGSHSHIGASFLLGRSSWFVRPALRTGAQYDSRNKQVEPTAGASLTFGRRYGARFIVHVDECDRTGGTAVCARFQMGGYISF